MATKLTVSKVVSNSPVPAPKVHMYKFKLTGDYDWGYVTASGDTLAEAQQNAIDEYFRQNAIAPVSVTLVSQIS